MKKYYIYQKCKRINLEDGIVRISPWVFYGQTYGSDNLFKIVKSLIAHEREKGFPFYLNSNFDSLLMQSNLILDGWQCEKIDYPVVFVIVDEKNKVVDKNKLCIILQNQIKKHNAKLKAYEPHCIYRKDPIPNGGCYSWNVYRNSHLTLKDDLSKDSIELKKEYPTTIIKIQRSKRKSSKINGYWNDKIRSSYRDRNWKKFRKKQYKDSRPTTHNFVRNTMFWSDYDFLIKPYKKVINKGDEWQLLLTKTANQLPDYVNSFDDFGYSY